MWGLGAPGDNPPPVEDYSSVAAAGEILDDDATLVATEIVGGQLWVTTRTDVGDDMVWMKGDSKSLEAWR